MSDELLEEQISDTSLTKEKEKIYTITPIEKSEIKKAMSGDEKAFESIFMGTYRYVFAVVRRYLKNDQDAYDAIQDTYTKVYKGLSRLESVDSFYPWLHRIAENCAKDILRVNNGAIFVDEESIEIIAEDKHDEADVTADITEILNQLPQEQTELLIRVYYDKMRISEIAKMWGVPATTLHNRLNAAKRKLKELLKIRGIDKPIYGGELVSVISNALRRIIGTELLSMAVAEEILHKVKKSANQKGAFVITEIARNMRNKAAGKIAAILLLVSVTLTLALVIVLATTIFVPRDNQEMQSLPPILSEINDSSNTTTSMSSDLTTTSDINDATSSVINSVNSANSDSTSSYDFYFSTMDDELTLKGSFTNTEVFGTHTENEELNMAVIGDTLYAVVKNNLVSLTNGSTAPTVLIKNFGTLYTESGRCLNVYNNEVYWINENGDDNFVLNRCNIDGTGHYSVVFSDTSCTYLYKLTVAKDGVYFCAGKHGDFNYRESGVLYRTDYDFNITNRQENIADYALVMDKIFVLFGKGNCGLPFSLDRATFTNLINISEDFISYSSIYAIGEYIVLDSQSPYKHSESGAGSDLKIMDTTQNKIVRAIYGEHGDIIDIKDINEADGTVLYSFNDISMTLSIKTNKTAVVNNHNGTTIKSNKYFIENDSLYYGNIQGTTKKKIY